MDRRLSVALALLALSGCADAPEPAATPTAEAPAADAFVWSGCEGATVNLHGPAALYPASAPASWGPGATPVVEVRVLLLECQRVSWGPFERGPVSIAQEWRDDFQAPEACVGTGSEARSLLESIWFSDAEVAAHAAGLGLPAREAAFARSGDAARQEWSWGPPGEPPSRAVLPSGAGLAPRIDEFARRVLWADGAGVGALDLRTTSAIDHLDPSTAAGELRPPMLYGRANAAPDFASARSSVVHSLEAAGQLHRYEDAGCERSR